MEISPPPSPPETPHDTSPQPQPPTSPSSFFTPPVSTSVSRATPQLPRPLSPRRSTRTTRPSRSCSGERGGGAVQAVKNISCSIVDDGLIHKVFPFMDGQTLRRYFFISLLTYNGNSCRYVIPTGVREYLSRIVGKMI
ncbi:uncharacterized protein LOC133885740 [Phragmites australis]|uniref:uncharacterized protein LOC133885740 n=1 Tax=Phragmites australis TaxID=29695 RepID=UPI002D78ABCE|nr:uncharacterized protein LOC133885740 [Phragmites australis]